MALVEFLKTAAGPTFGPYEVGDVADLDAPTVTHLGDAVTADVDPGAIATEPSGTT